MAAWDSPPPFQFEIKGHTYEVTPLGDRPFKEGLRWRTIFAGDEPAPSPEDEPGQLLGQDVYDRMLEDGAPYDAVRRAMLTVFTDFKLNDRDIADKVWDAGLTPEVLAPLGANQEATTPQPSSGSESATPSPASTKATTSRTAGSKKRRAKASTSTKP
jgi:hypothetical protein